MTELTFLLRRGLSLPLTLLLAVNGLSTGRLQHHTSSPRASQQGSLFYNQVQEWLIEECVTFKPALPEAIQSLSKGLCGDDPPPTRLLELTTLTNPNATIHIALHLIPTPTCTAECLDPRLLKTWTETAEEDDSNRYSKIIHLHEDVWYQKPMIVRCRLLAQLGRNSRRIFARTTTARRIDATQAMEFLQQHHLWGATRAKYYYGLFSKRGNQLEAVATFSNRRKVLRDSRPHRSHELLRLCSQRDSVVVGGISKLLKSFCRDQRPDDIVTVVDRNWGTGSGWHSVGFSTVTVLDPIVMVVSPKEHGVRRHLVGAGIRHDNTVESGRLGLSTHVMEQLNTTTCANEARQILEHFQYYPVYDAGVERLYTLVNADSDDGHDDPMELWRNSQPSYPSGYYSSNLGITALLEDASLESK